MRPRRRRTWGGRNKARTLAHGRTGTAPGPEGIHPLTNLVTSRTMVRIHARRCAPRDSIALPHPEHATRPPTRRRYRFRDSTVISIGAEAPRRIDETP